MKPTATRPYMPGYGIQEAEKGLLPWAWAEERLTSSHDYWVATVGPDGQPNVMPVWGAWMDDAVWFSSSPGSRRARNLEVRPRCTITTLDAQEPVVVEGIAELVHDRSAAEAFCAAANEKYGESMTVDFVVENALFFVRPVKVLSLTEADFTGSPTRWQF